MRHRILFALQIACGASLISTTSAMGQTLFSRSHDGPNFGNYQTIWECLAATSRVSDSVRSRLPIFADTMAGEYSVASVLSDPVAKVARACLDNIPKRIGQEDSRNYIRLLLKAGRDSIAKSIAWQWLATAIESRTESGSSSSMSLGSSVDTSASVDSSVLRNRAYQLLYIFLEEYPTQWEMVEKLMPLSAPDTNSGKVKTIGDAAAVALRQTDSARAIEWAKMGLALADQLTPEQRSDPSWQEHIKPYVAALYDILYQPSDIDILRREGVEAYIEQMRKRSVRVEHGKRNGAPVLGLVGKMAPAIRGSYWDPIPTTPEWPSQGAVHLIVFTDVSITRNFGIPRLPEAFAMLRRLQSRFPDLQVTVATRTLGYFGEQTPPSPPQEATLLSEWIHKFWSIRAFVAVAETQFFRLPGLDQRRINQSTDNEMNYNVDLADGRGNVHCFIVAKDGRIIRADALGKRSEVALGQLINVLLAR